MFLQLVVFICLVAAVVAYASYLFPRYFVRIVLAGSAAVGVVAFLIGRTAHAASFPVFVTSYNAEAKQTDDSPCVGASGRDLCVAAREGDRTIALSQDLVRRFRWHDKVKLTSMVPQCNGVFSVEDSMHHRWRRRADLFFLDRKDNTSCSATVEPFSY